MPDRDRKKPFGKDGGAAAVEFAFALMALFVFFGIFMQFVMVFIAGERLSFAGFSAARTFAVQGHPPAIHAVGQIDPDAAVEFGSGEIVVTRDIPVPAGIDRFLTRGEGRFAIRHSSPAFPEPRYNDDNPDPF